MTTRLQRIALGVGAALIAVGVGAGVHASPQDTAGGPPPPKMGPGGPGGPMGPMGLMGPLGNVRMLAERLGLSAAQQDQIKSIAQSHHDGWKTLADRAIAAHKALNAAVTSDTVDETAIRAKSAEVAAVEADIAVARARTHAEVFQVLTPDQQAKARSLRGQMEQRMGQHGPRGRRPGGPQGAQGR